MCACACVRACVCVVRHQLNSPFTRVGGVQLEEHIGPNSRSGCCCQGYNRNTRKVLTELTKSFVVWSKIMAPLTNTVCFIDNKPSEELEMASVNINTNENT